MPQETQRPNREQEKDDRGSSTQKGVNKQQTNSDRSQEDLQKKYLPKRKHRQVSTAATG